MAQFYEMPAVSPTMELGTLVEWRVKEGESFKPQTVMAEVGTDKANMDAEVFDSGVLIRHLIEEGDEVPAGFPIAIIGQATDEDISELLEAFKARKAELDGGGAASDDDAGDDDAGDDDEDSASKDDTSASESDDDAGDDKPKPKAKAPAPPRREPVHRTWEGAKLSSNFMDPPGDIGAANTPERLAASPLARRIAQDKGVDLHRITGSGPGGRIVKNDVVQAAEQPAVAQAGPARESERVRNSPMRKTIAKRLLESHRDIPTFFLTIELDMQGFVDLRGQLKATAPDVKVSYNDMLIKAVARALVDSPAVNASWSDKVITRHGSVDIGVAVALPDGLITPVIRSADQLGLAEIGSQVRELAGLARDGKLSPEQYQGNTFTISNLGMFGIHEFTAIINPPASAILAVGALERVPVIDEGGQVVSAWRMKVTMTCDHRVIDGATGAEFLQALRRYVESPALLLL